jgi:NADH-quinone oxidoreductase subunit A
VSAEQEGRLRVKVRKSGGGCVRGQGRCVFLQRESRGKRASGFKTTKCIIFSVGHAVRAACRRGQFQRHLWLTPAGGQSKPESGCTLVASNKEHALDILLREYLPIVIFLALAVGLGLVLILAAVVLAVRNPDPEKVSAYECGFNAFDDARMKFDVRFYLVSILFIIFDLEVAFLFPWAVAFGEISMVAFWSMMAFLGVLTIGFAYEWKKGALEWE